MLCQTDSCALISDEFLPSFSSRFKVEKMFIVKIRNTREGTGIGSLLWHGDARHAKKRFRLKADLSEANGIEGARYENAKPAEITIAVLEL